MVINKDFQYYFYIEMQNGYVYNIDGSENRIETPNSSCKMTNS